MIVDKAPKSSDGGDGALIAFRLDSRSGVPTYLQIVHQVEHALRLGYLRKHDQLPRVRDVVESLSINPNTVLKAYRELERKGIISGRPGRGTFVEADPETVDLQSLSVLRRSLTTGWLREAAAAGLDEDGMVALFTSALREFRERSVAENQARPMSKKKGEGAA